MFVDLVVAVNVGVILAALFFMRRMADSVNVEQQLDLPPENAAFGVDLLDGEFGAHHFVLSHSGIYASQWIYEAKPKWRLPASLNDKR